MEFLALTAAPWRSSCSLASLAFTAKVVLPTALGGPFFALHIGSLFASFALLTLASGAGAWFLNLEKRIKSKAKLTGFQQDMPSLNALDSANHWAVVLGFPLYSLGLVAGFIWGWFTWGRTRNGAS